ncbi:8777_t:CDS:2, partial [Racocetra fulgida]
VHQVIEKILLEQLMIERSSAERELEEDSSTTVPLVKDKLTTQAIQHNPYNPYKSRLIFGTHFATCKNSACIFTPNDKAQNNVNDLILRLKLFSSKGNSGQISIEWEDLDNTSISFVNPFSKNCSNVQLYHGFLNVDVGSKKVTENSVTPIWVSQ